MNKKPSEKVIAEEDNNIVLAINQLHNRIGEDDLQFPASIRKLFGLELSDPVFDKASVLLAENYTQGIGKHSLWNKAYEVNTVERNFTALFWFISYQYFSEKYEVPLSWVAALRMSFDPTTMKWELLDLQKFDDPIGCNESIWAAHLDGVEEGRFISTSFPLIRKIDNVEKFIEKLKDDDFDVRRSAVNALQDISDNRAIEPLIEALKNEHKLNIRWSIRRGIKKIGGENVVESLINALTDDDHKGREAIAEALGGYRDERVVEPLIAALKDEEPRVREAAARALGDVNDVQAVEPLIEALKDEEPKVREAAARALGCFKGGVKDKLAVEPLIEALKDEEPKVREAAASALEDVNDVQAVEPLIEALKDEEKEVREAAASALGRYKDERAVEPLIEAMLCLNGGGWASESAAKSLSQIGGERAIEALIAVLKDQTMGGETVAAAVSVITVCQDERGVEALIEALKHENFYAVTRAAWFLGAIASHGPMSKLDSVVEQSRIVQAKLVRERAVEPLIEALKGEQYFRRLTSALGIGQALVEIGTEHVVEELIDLLKYENTRANGSQVQVRNVAAYALGEIGDIRAVGPLIEALEEKDLDLYSTVTIALAEIGDERAVEPLIEALKDDDWYVRVSSARALGIIGDERAVEPLNEALKDDEESVRESVSIALKEFGEDKARVANGHR